MHYAHRRDGIPRFATLTLALCCAAAQAVRAQDQLDMSYDPPGGLKVEETPQFIVLGFDDNRYIDGMQWVMELLEGKKNPAGKGNPSTFDGQPIKAAFYFTSSAAMPGNGRNPAYTADLLKLWKRAVAGGHEVANHTHTHETSDAHSKEQWLKEMKDCQANLVDLLQVPSSEIVGFRTPYLAFNKATFDAVKEMGLLYEATVTHQTEFNRKQHTWPYTLHKGFSDRSIAQSSWIYPGLWEIPVYTTSTDATGHPPVTGFDSSILTQAYGNQYAAMLKNGLDYRLTAMGNRAPYTVGLHSDTYSNENEHAKIHYDPRLGLEERKKALADFIAYALTKPDVRFVTAKQLIAWMKKPVALQNITTIAADRTKARLEAASLIRVKSGSMALTLPAGDTWTVSATTPAGREVYRSGPIAGGAGGEHVTVAMGAFPKGALVIKLEGKDASWSRMVAVP